MLLEENHLSEVEAYRALSSKSRLEILKLLYKNSLSVEELAKTLRLQPITVRHHLQALQEAGFIEAFEERAGSVGRPKLYYRIVKEPPLLSFPKRRYLTLSNFVINTLKFLLGESRAKKILWKAGAEMGENAIKRLESEYNIKKWTIKTYEQLFIKDYLEESGAEPEIVELSEKKVVYRLHNCLFFELAIRMPEVMCDTLHESFHEGVTKAMGEKFRISRKTCMAKGDLYCEHICEKVK